MQHLNPLYWHQGMFLQPQHFQYIEQYQDAHQALTRHLFFSDPVGIYELEINDDALADGRFELSNIKAVFTDTSLVCFPGNTLLNGLNLSIDDLDEQGGVNIFLGLTPLDNKKSNVGELSRFMLDPEHRDLSDLYDSEEKTQVQTLEFNCSLVKGEKSHLPDYRIYLQIARVLMVGQQFQLCSDFIPNIKRIQASSVLSDYIKRAKNKLLSRYEQLESYNLFLSTTKNELTPVSLGYMSALQIMARYIAQFSVFEEAPVASPLELYSVYKQVIAELSLFSKQVSVTGATRDTQSGSGGWHGDKLSEQFNRLDHLLNKLLDELTVDPELIQPLVDKGHHKFIADLPQIFLEPHVSVYLRLKTQFSLDETIASLCQHAKLGDDKQVDVYIKRALNGVPINYLSRKPVGVAGSPDSYFFTLDRDDYCWHKVVESHRLAFVWSQAPEDLKVDLVAVRT